MQSGTCAVLKANRYPLPTLLELEQAHNTFLESANKYVDKITDAYRKSGVLKQPMGSVFPQKGLSMYLINIVHFGTYQQNWFQHNRSTKDILPLNRKESITQTRRANHKTKPTTDSSVHHSPGHTPLIARITTASRYTRHTCDGLRHNSW